MSLAPLLDCRISSFLLGPLAVPSWEDAPRVPHLPPPVHKTKVPLAMASSLFRAHELPSSQSQSSGPSGSSPDTGTRAVASWDIDRGGLGAEPVPGTEGPSGFPLRLSGGDGLAPVGQLMDVSQLLRLYQARGWGALPAEDLLLYLKRQEHGRYQPGGHWQGGVAHGQPGSDGPAGRVWATEPRRSIPCSFPGKEVRSGGPTVFSLPLSLGAPTSLWSLPFQCPFPHL